MNYKESLNIYRIQFNSSLQMINRIPSNSKYTKKYRTILKLSKILIKKYKSKAENFCFNQIDGLIDFMKQTSIRINSLNSKDLLKEIHDSIYLKMDQTIENIKNYEQFMIRNMK